jgi:Tfp pilus assembly protein PilP
MSRKDKRAFRVTMLSLAAGLLLLMTALTMPACGDDAPKKKDGKGAESGRRVGPKGPAAAKGKSKASIAPYPKVKEEDRRNFKEADFRADPTGEENRNPFQSFVIRDGNPLRSGNSTLQASNICRHQEWVASELSLRDFKLIAIILHGTKAWAQLRDKAGLGHTVQRGNCVGKERGVVEEIGDNFVRVKVIPDAPPGAATPEPQTVEFALYPSELKLADSTANAPAN